MLRHPTSPDELLTAVRGQTIASMFARTVSSRPGAPAVRWLERREWAQLTWAEYADQATRIAAGLTMLGLGRGEQVALMMRNRAEFHPVDMAVYLAGGTAFSIYNSSSVEQVTYLLNHSEAAIAIVGEPDLVAVVDKARVDAPALRHVVAIDGGSGGATDVHYWHELLSTEPLDIEHAASLVSPSDIAAFIYTSGTTGPPKAVMLTHENVCTAVEAFKAVLGIDMAGRRMVSYLPMAHIAERLLTHYLAAGTGVVAHPWSDPATIASYLPVVRPEVFFGPPRVFEKLCSSVRATSRSDHATEDARDVRAQLGLDECKIALTGAAPPPIDVIEFFDAMGLPLAEAYGLSESTGLATGSMRDSRPGLVGPPVPGCEVSLHDDGEILCRAPFVFAGYFRDPDRTADALDADGWLHTGDIGVFEDGYVRIVDRKKELIVTSGGKNIAPTNLENALKEIRLIGQACVIGDRRPYVIALLVLDAEAAGAWAAQRGIDAISLEQLAGDPRVRDEIEEGVSLVNQRVSTAEQIKKFIVLSDEWMADSDILTPTMKLKRRAVIDRYEVLIDSLYAQERDTTAG